MCSFCAKSVHLKGTVANAILKAKSKLGFRFVYIRKSKERQSRQRESLYKLAVTNGEKRGIRECSDRCRYASTAGVLPHSLSLPLSLNVLQAGRQTNLSFINASIAATIAAIVKIKVNPY